MGGYERTFLGESSVRDRWQIDERPGQRRPSVDVELVALRVIHRDCVVVEALRVQDADEQGTEIGQTGRLRVDALPARLDRNRAAATDSDIEVQPVLGRFAVRYHLEPDPRPTPVGIDDAVRASAQLILWHSDVSPVRIPAGEAIWRRFKLVAQCRGPEARERLRVSAVDHQLEAHGHRSLLGAGNVSSPVCMEPMTPTRPPYRRQMSRVCLAGIFCRAGRELMAADLYGAGQPVQCRLCTRLEADDA